MFEAQPEVIAASGATEAGIAQAMVASASAKAPMLVGVLPMGLDPTSVAFAAAMNAAGGALLGAHNIQAADRLSFSVAQQTAGTTISMTETIRAATAAL